MKLSKELILALINQEDLNRFEATYRDKKCIIEIDCNFVCFEFENDSNRVSFQQEVDEVKKTISTYDIQVYTLVVGFSIPAYSSLFFSEFSDMKFLGSYKVN